MGLVTSKGHYLGLRKSLPDPRDYQFKEHFTAQPVAGPIDYRNEFPDAYNQEQEGSCTSFASGAAYRRSRRKRHNLPIPAVWAPSLHYGALEDFDISFQLQYWFSRSLEGTDASDAGSTIRDAVSALHQFGAAAWHNYPYVAGQYAQTPPQSAIDHAKNHEIANYYALDGTVEGYKQALAQGFTPLFGILLYSSYYRAAINGIVPEPDPTTDQLEGGHALCGVGWTPNARGTGIAAFIVRGSWGPWGDNGYVYLPETYIANPQLAFDPWVISLGAN